MPDYDSLRDARPGWRNRFPEDSAGNDVWREQPEPFAVADDAGRAWLRQLRAEAERRPPQPCPRLFISYRMADRQKALRVAWLAHQQRFDFWLDVMNPRLPRLASQGWTPQNAIAIAGIIEMGLLNCSHVIALITPRTRGSMWVPYEYGRVKEDQPLSIRSACWRHPQHPPKLLAEYLLLGTIHSTEAEISDWLRDERRQWAGRCLQPQDRWHGAEPDQLPV